MDGKLPNYSVISPVRNMLKWERRDNMDMQNLIFTIGLLAGVVVGIVVGQFIQLDIRKGKK
jgi:hypothetical protein